jgi:hypothetical protein
MASKELSWRRDRRLEGTLPSGEARAVDAAMQMAHDALDGGGDGEEV